MGAPFHFVEKVQIIRKNPFIYEGLAEGKERLFLIIDPFEQDGLVEKRDAELSYALQGGDYVLIELSCVVAVDDEDNLLRVRLKEGQEAAVDPLGDADGKAGMKPDPLDMRTGGERSEKRLHRLIR